LFKGIFVYFPLICSAPEAGGQKKRTLWHRLFPSDVPSLEPPGLNRFQSLFPGIALEKRQGFGRLARIGLANRLSAGSVDEQ
jgi:hypothetical protein